MKRLLRFFAVAAFYTIACVCQAAELQKVTFGTNWLAQGEHGGFYQALADGTYKRFGLDVTIVPGSPQANPRLLLTAGKIDFYMGGTMLEPFAAVQNGVPTRAVAAIFQKDPQVFITHPESGAVTFEDLKNRTLFISRMIEATLFQWMKQAYGFDPANVRPYASNPAPFCADKNSVQQGYATSEPYTIEQACGFSPRVFFVSDAGYDSYSTLIETRQDMIDQHPDLVQRFVDASILGWKNYLHGDNAQANALIKKANPEMTDARLKNTLDKMKLYNFAESGDAAANGIGAMTEAHHRQFFQTLVEAGLFPQNLSFEKAYTLQFVNKHVGLDTVAK